MVYIQAVQHSFAAWRRYLDRPKVAFRAVLVLLLIHSALLAYSAYVHSPTLNEPGHLVAGLSHWKFGRFELYRVNPPLVRMVAALPVMAVGYEEDWSGFYEGPGARPVFEIGEDFVAANGERSFYLFMIARWACIPFSWLGAITCYLWARDLYSQPAGIFACTLWCFSPSILAHASLITADAHATALGLAACYTFWRWLKKPTWQQAAITGCVLGLAELAKTTLVLFYPLWPLLWIVYRWPDRLRMSKYDWFREAGMLFLRMAIGIYVLNIGYGYEGSLKPLKEFHFISNLFTGNNLERGERQTITSASLHDTISVNRFRKTWLGSIPVPFPENYIRGIDVQQEDFEHFDRPSYLRGKFQDRGWWYYYLYAIAIKVPLGVWGIAGVVLLMKKRRILHSPVCRNELILLTPAFVIFSVVSSKTGFSHHMRYVIPCFPFAFIWLSQASQIFSFSSYSLAKADEGNSAADSTINISTLQNKHLFFATPALTSILLAWFVCSVSTYPHSISYFNEMVGGPIGGPNHLINSNVDWGQDLRYLKWWREKHRNELQDEPFYLAYYGYANPENLGFSDALPWPPLEGEDTQDIGTISTDVAPDSLPELKSGYYAISVNLLRGTSWQARDGQQSARKHLKQPLLEYFQKLQPCGRAGFSILIFHVSNSANSALQ